MKLRRGGVAREVPFASIFYLGARRRLQTIKQKRGGSLVIVANFSGPLSVTAVDCNNTPTGSNTTNFTAATISGGVVPYTYSWAVISGSATITSPTSAQTKFTKAFTSDGETITARVTVTDGLGATASATITATWYFPVTPGV